MFLLSHIMTAGSIHSYHSSKHFELFWVEGLNKSIYNHVFCRYVIDSNLF